MAKQSKPGQQKATSSHGLIWSWTSDLLTGELQLTLSQGETQILTYKSRQHSLNDEGVGWRLLSAYPYCQLTIKNYLLLRVLCGRQSYQFEYDRFFNLIGVRTSEGRRPKFEFSYYDIFDSLKDVRKGSCQWRFAYQQASLGIQATEQIRICKDQKTLREVNLFSYKREELHKSERKP